MREGWSDVRQGCRSVRTCWSDLRMYGTNMRRWWRNFNLRRSWGNFRRGCRDLRRDGIQWRRGFASCWQGILNLCRCLVPIDRPADPGSGLEQDSEPPTTNRPIVPIPSKPSRLSVLSSAQSQPSLVTLYYDASASDPPNSPSPPSPRRHSLPSRSSSPSLSSRKGQTSVTPSLIKVNITPSPDESSQQGSSSTLRTSSTKLPPISGTSPAPVPPLQKNVYSEREPDTP